MSEQPIVQPRDRVRFWIAQTGLQGQTGTVIAAECVSEFGNATYAEIEPDELPHTHKFLFHRAIWGFEPLEQESL